MMSSLESLNPLLRFPAFRWIGALLLALPLAWLTRAAVGGPPANYAQWPSDARAATAGLIDGVDGLVLAAWLAGWAGALRWVQPPWARTAALGASALLACSHVSGACWELLTALGPLTALPAPGVAAVLRLVAWVAIAPAVVGAATLLWVAAHERVAALPFLPRWFRTGRGAGGGWMSSETLKQYTRPLPRRLP